jgi:hypothetical protein
MRPRLDHAREVQGLTINWCSKAGKPIPEKIETYRIAAVLVYSLLGSISRPFSSTSLIKLKVDRTDAATSVRIE